MVLTLPEMLYQLILGPLVLLFDTVFSLAHRFVTRSPGLLIIFLSLTMNLLVLPLYRRADALQEEERVQAAKLEPGVRHIKKTFKGNERFMLLQTYYRQNNYKPYYALKGSLSLLLEVPFFIAAYRFLSNLQMLQHTPFGPIQDLGAPDGLLNIAGHAVNLLPILMTGINILSGAIYTRGMPLRSKLQLYAMALVFLVFLYGSPSGLVFYWTLNNVFSLAKNIFYRLRNPKKALLGLCTILGLMLLALLVPFHGRKQLVSRMFMLAAGVLLQLPLILHLVFRGRPQRPAARETRSDRLVFYIGCIFLTLLLGMTIPIDVIKSSPDEFIDIASYQSSLVYVLSATLLAAGTFLIWVNVFYQLSSERVRRFFSFAVSSASVVCVFDYLFFGGNYGSMNADLKYERLFIISRKQYLINTLAIVALILIVWVIWKRRQAFIRIAGAVACVSILGMSAVNTVSVERLNRHLQATTDHLFQATIPLDRTGKNVVVIMMDRAVGRFLPYLFQEKPELMEQFAGFTYYPNCMSYGTSTNVATPALFGGYEYTPVEMNRRTSQLLAEKHNEALKLMPRLFGSSGYDVTVCDPPYAGYTNIPDLSIYDDCPRVNACILQTSRAIDEEYVKVETAQSRRRNFFCYSIFRCSPLVTHSALYNQGRYNESNSIMVQIVDGISKSRGYHYTFVQDYGVLNKMPQYCTIRDEGRGTLLLFTNNTTHSPSLLSEPEYEPSLEIDNTAYDAEHAERFAWDGTSIHLTTLRQMQHYQINMASMIQIGNWMDYLRANGVYDNTRIIITADHGTWLENLFDSTMADGTDSIFFNPLMMVKDFGCTEFHTDSRFMTNADTPLLAMEGIIADPVNPFTGNPLSDDQKRQPIQYVAGIKEYRPTRNNGTAFKTVTWFANTNDVLNLEAWSIIGHELKE